MLRQSLLRPFAQATSLRNAQGLRIPVNQTLLQRNLNTAAKTSFLPKQSALTVANAASTFQMVKRGEANKQSTKPASVDVQHATTNAREEAQNVAKDFATIIGGSSPKSATAGARELAHEQGTIADDFVTITKSFVGEIPKPVMNMGLAGTIPYIGTSLGTVFLARDASIAAEGGEPWSGMQFDEILNTLTTMEHVQITYGAVLLSFLGALHWGMEFAELGGRQGYKRLAIGALPVLLAWPTTFLSHGTALVAQWASFTGVWMIDNRAAGAGWTPDWYSTYRFYLSIIVGFSIIGTLAGTSYYGVGSGASRSDVPGSPESATAKISSLKRIDKVKVTDHPAVSGIQKGKLGGDIDTKDLVEEGSGEGYVKLHNLEKEREQKEAEEKEKAEKAKEQNEKDKKQADKSPNDMKSETKDREDGKKEKPADEEKK